MDACHFLVVLYDVSVDPSVTQYELPFPLVFHKSRCCPLANIPSLLFFSEELPDVALFLFG
jgi:hypothetical protein